MKHLLQKMAARHDHNSSCQGLVCVVMLLTAFLLIPATMMAKKTKTVDLTFIETTDVHGAFFPYDYIQHQPMPGTLARVSTYINKVRQTEGDNLILLENGDILQGQPVCYYSNYIDTLSHNVAADIVNYLGYSAQTFGNHDVETGHAVYDKWAGEIKCPVLGANIIDTKTNQPYVKPYTLLVRDGVRIAIIGLLTPAIPSWLPENLWTGLRFDDMVETARRYVKTVRENEQADVVVGLFHSGRDGGIVTDEYTENASLRIAREVEGFDAVFFGHDHTRYCEDITSATGQIVSCINPANNARAVGQLKLTLEKQKAGWTIISRESSLPDVTGEEIDEAYMAHFKPFTTRIEQYANETVGAFKNTVYTRDSFFGNSAFTDLIHQMQIAITGADISFNAPLSFDTKIEAGPVNVGDMFNLYRFENKLYVMRLTGAEIRRYLEMSYGLWVNTMISADDHLLLLEAQTRGDAQRMGFKNYTFNFDSAYGIDYEVDVTKPEGQRVRILQMSNGQPFDEGASYRVAVNSYRGNGGGELLTRGAGIPKDQLAERIVWQSDRDQRYYLTEEIRRQGTIDPQPGNNWRFVPEEWTIPAAQRDRQLLFGKE